MTYQVLIESGHQAAYLDQCTLFDLDLFSRQHVELMKKRGPRFF